MKTCTACGLSKPLYNFARSARAKDGLHTWCKPCKASSARAWYHATPERQKARNKRRYQQHGAEMRAGAERWYAAHREHALGLKRAWALKRFGLTLAEYDERVQQQKGECSICGKQPALKQRRSLRVDHCHGTGVVRGLLCHHCNVGIGHFFDSPDLLRAAADYLSRFVGKKTA